MKNSWIAAIIESGIRVKRGDGAMLPENMDPSHMNGEMDEKSRAQQSWVAAMMNSLQISRKVLLECEEMTSRELDLLYR